MAWCYVYAKRRNYPVYPRAHRARNSSCSRGAVLPILDARPSSSAASCCGFFTPTEASRGRRALCAMLLGLLIYREHGPTAAARRIVQTRPALPRSRCSASARPRRSAGCWPISTFPQLFVDMVVQLGRGHHQRGLHHRVLLPGDRLLHRRDSGDHHRRHHPGAAGARPWACTRSTSPSSA